MRRFTAINIAKQASFWSRVFGRGGGGALPGLLAERIDPRVVAKLTRNLKSGVILVTGTNGKTTTAKMITEILEESGLEVVNNSGGSNLTRGIASALIAEASIFGKIRKDIGVYEVDEATMPQVANLVEPIAVVVTNIFRDQLDRYGEVDKTAAILKEAISKHPKTTLVLNADDPMVTTLGEKHKKTVYFGVNDEKIEAASDLAIDIKDCPVCANELLYKSRYYGHIGIYLCKKCKFKRPAPDITAEGLKLTKDRLSAKIIIKKKPKTLDLPIGGLYNLYNALGAISLTSTLGVKAEIIFHALCDLAPAFGRMEKLVTDEKEVTINLVKNPTGFNQVLENIVPSDNMNTLLIALNDNFADGTDISWIWDVDIELLKSNFRRIVLSGIRTEDLALRLKYADVWPEKISSEKDIKKALVEAIEETHKGESLYILPTYTAMLSLRNILVQQGILEKYWDMK